ncbi:MAG TPA: Trm112 family protein [Ilumatobacter sp.]|nr:Trm112 family protein [Ilumatobacter sp.]
MSLDAALLSILACPEDKGPLYYVESESVLYNPRIGRTYEVRGNIPVMLIDESTTLDDDARAKFDALVADQKIAPTFDA